MDKVSGKSTKVRLLTALLCWDSDWMKKRKDLVKKWPYYWVLLCYVMHCALVDRLLKGCCLGLATCLIYRHFSWREGTHWIDSFCNFPPLHHCTFLFTMPQPLCSDCCQSSLTGWGKAGDAAQWNRTEKGSRIHLFQWCCCHVLQRLNNCLMDSFHLYLVLKSVSLPVKAMATTEKKSPLFINQCLYLYCRLQSFLWCNQPCICTLL